MTHPLPFEIQAYVSHNGGKLPALITRVACVGVERRLIDCQINAALDYYMCNTVEISVNNGKNFLMVHLAVICTLYSTHRCPAFM